jgi:hypothetical protein
MGVVPPMRGTPEKQFRDRLRQVLENREAFRREARGTVLSKDEMLRCIALRNVEDIARNDHPLCAYIGFTLKDGGAYVVCPVEDFSDEELNGFPV